MRKFICALLTTAILSISAVTAFAAETADYSTVGIVYGDVDGNGSVSIDDATFLQKYLAGFTMPDYFVSAAADVDGDSEITVSDVTCIQKYLAGFSSGTGRAGENVMFETEHKLVRSVREYMLDYETNDWKLYHTTNIEYENAYPTTIDMVYSDEDFEPTTTFFEYTFENDLPKTCTITDNQSGDVTTITYNNGRQYDFHIDFSNGGYVNTWYQYANGDAYFTSLFHEGYAAGNEYFPEQFDEETDSVQVMTENGLMKKSINTGYYANWNEREPKKWLRFNGTYTAEYDEDGIISVMSADYRMGPSTTQYVYETKKVNGVITEIIEKQPDGNGGYTPMKKCEFEYTDTKISAARYSQMMNYFIIGSGSNYYINNWY